MIRAIIVVELIFWQGEKQDDKVVDTSFIKENLQPY